METRKPNRLKEYNYSASGYYFITVCTKEKQKILCDIVGCGVLDTPKIQLTSIGKIIENQIVVMQDFYNHIKIDKYVIMPNHIHLILNIVQENGVSGTPRPTNNIISSFVGTFKRYTNKSSSNNLWQISFYEHIIRDEADYLRICEYIENNPSKWSEDKYYIKNEYKTEKSP